MSFVYRGLLGLALITSISACSGSSNGPGTTTTTAAAADPNAAQTYVQPANLILAHTGDVLGTEASANQIKISGQGTQSTYKAQYNFNSANNLALKLMSSSMATMTTSFGDCTVQNPSVTLIDGTHRQELDLMSQVNLDMNTDYTIELQVQQNCSTLDLTLGVTVWVSPIRTSDTFMVEQCLGQHGERLSFFPINGLTAYSDMSAGKPFLDIADFCGESVSINNQQSTCSFSEDTQSTGPDSVTCTMAAGPDQRSFSISFDSSGSIGSFACQKSGVQTYAEKMTNCQSMILDLNTFKQPL